MASTRYGILLFVAAEIDFDLLVHFFTLGGFICKRGITKSDLTLKLIFWGGLLDASRKWAKEAVAAITPITSPFSLNNGPLELPGWIGIETCK